MKKSKIRINFRHNLPGEEHQFLKLMSIAGYRHVDVITDENEKVDISFCGPYHGGIGDYNLDYLKRVKRGVVSKTGPGRHLLLTKLAGGVQPNPKARVNIWYTGENQRPPFGSWDGYFSFEIDKMRGKNVYWPQAWLATNFLDKELKQTPWNSTILDVEKSTKRRPYSNRRKPKFAVAFLGKLHPSRLHLLKAMSHIGKVDIYGIASRKPVESKIEIARNYRFIICPENDLYPGYVTEKAIEAYVSTCIPIYSGLDPLQILNPKAIVNFANILDESVLIEKVSNLNRIQNEYEETFTEPILCKEPSYHDAVLKIQELLG